MNVLPNEPLVLPVVSFFDTPRYGVIFTKIEQGLIFANLRDNSYEYLCVNVFFTFSVKHLEEYMNPQTLVRKPFQKNSFELF